MNSESSTYALLFLVLLVTPAVFGIIISRKREKSPLEYFLGSKSLGALSLGNTLLLVGLGSLWLLAAGNGFYAGMHTALWFSFVSVAMLVILGFHIAPMYLKSGVFTAPQFLSYRFNERTGLLWSSISVVLYVGVKIPLLIAVASWTTRSLWGWEILSSAGLVVAIVLTGLYTVMGGFTSVVRTQILQAGFAFAGFIFMIGWMLAHPDLQVGELPTADTGRILPTMFIALPILLAWHWWIDQSSVQRVCAARNVETARKGIMAASIGLLAVLALWLSVAGSDLYHIAARIGDDYLLKGVGSTVSLLLFMALLASDIHSTSTLITMDHYRMTHPEASDESLVLIGRLSATLVVVFAILMVSANTLVDSSIVLVFREAPFHIAPPIVAVAVIGILWPRMNASGAFWGLLAGEGLGVANIVARSMNGVGTGSILGMSPDRFCIVSFMVTGILFVVISLATAAPSEETNAYMSIVRRKQG